MSSMQNQLMKEKCLKKKLPYQDFLNIHLKTITPYLLQNL